MRRAPARQGADHTESDPAQLPVPIAEPAIPPARASAGAVSSGALGGLVVLGLGLGISNLVEDLFNRSASLGYIGWCSRSSPWWR
jgi:putative membrane protein